MGKTRHGGALLVECLITLGATRAFGVPGESYLPVLDALFDRKGQFDFTLCRHEGAAAFMAEAWGKLTGTPGIAFVTRGPGATNASIGVHTAMQSSTPLILFVGQVGTALKGREAFQELDYGAVFGSMAKWVTEIDRIDRMAETVSRAWAVAMSGRPGPVVVALPEDVLTTRSDLPVCAPVRISSPAPSQTALTELGHRLSRAERPLVIAGGSGWSADGKADLARFLTAQGVPALVSFRRHDLLDNHAPFYAGEAGVGMTPHVRGLISGADLILALNIRFGEMSMDAYSIAPPPRLGAELVHVHKSAAELNKIYTADLPIEADPNEMAAALAALPASPSPSPDWILTARQGFSSGLSVPSQPGAFDMGDAMEVLQKEVGDDAVITNGAGNFAIWPNKHFLFGANQRLLAPQSGAMGYGLPAAIAAKIADPDRMVLCFAGDGDIQMTISELGTAMQEGAQPILLILNNGTYGTIRMHQERHFPGRVSGTDLVNPDFCALARSYGFHAERVSQTRAFADAFARARESRTGAVLELMIETEALGPKLTLSALRAEGEAPSTVSGKE